MCDFRKLYDFWKRTYFLRVTKLTVFSVGLTILDSTTVGQLDSAMIKDRRKVGTE